jgi:hypothetical protein
LAPSQGARHHLDAGRLGVSLVRRLGSRLSLPALALLDVDFAKHQIELMLSDRYLHPNGQIPAYEWGFDDANPPVHAQGALKVFRAERVQRGTGDLDFPQRVFHKLLLNLAWWINRKDADGHNLFEGGFLGLDNISVYDRSHPLPPGHSLKQADATGWMAMFSLNMTMIALELCAKDSNYEAMAIHCYKQFLAIGEAIAGNPETGMPSLWDAEKGFFMDLLVTPDGVGHRIEVYSWVGLIPLFAAEIVDKRLLANAPRFADLLGAHKGGLFRGSTVCLCPDWENDRGEHLLALVDHTMLPRILERLLDEEQFLSRFGIRSVSRIHATQTHLGRIPGIGEALMEYVPGESNSPLFGGNSNWRGPVWLPTNYSLVQALEKYHRFLGPGFQVPVACKDGQRLNLAEIATLIAERLVDLYRPRTAPRPRPCTRGSSARRRPLARPAELPRVFPRRDRRGSRRLAPNRLDGTARQPGDAPLSEGHHAMERAGPRDRGRADRRDCLRAKAIPGRFAPRTLCRR